MAAMVISGSRLARRDDGKKRIGFLRFLPPFHTFPHPTMLTLIQRVCQASVVVEGETVGAIGPGLLALVGIEPGDGDVQVARMAERLLGYRVFADAEGRMNRSLTDTGGGLLLVSQFTLAADTSSGMRPGFSTAAPPVEAERIFGDLVGRCRQKHAPGVEIGRFGAHMTVSLVNDGPVTFLLRA
jgi:D-aminoacyl-tRNA deacylase